MLPGIDDSMLKSVHLFKDVDLNTVRHWLDQCDYLCFREGELLLSPQQPNTALFIILRGEAVVYIDDSMSVPLATLGEGESVGEMSLFDGEPPSAFVEAVSDLEVLKIPGKVLSAMIDDSQGIARNLIYLLSNRLRSGNKTVKQTQHLQQEFEKHANIDGLTGLYNRRWIDNYFQRIFSSRKPKGPLSVLILDVDNFKQFNDTFGHLAGDYALRCVAEVMHDSVRPADRVARYGGEEFLVILPDTPLEEAGLIGQRICDKLAQRGLKFEGEVLPSITASLGGSQLQQNDSFESLISAADTALYEAKGAGKHCVRLTDRSIRVIETPREHSS